MPLPQPTSLRDRTHEFSAIVERLQRQPGFAPALNGTTNGSPAPPKNAIQQNSEFAKKASEVGLGIAKTSARLQELTRLAKRPSTFNDPAQEINDLTGTIKLEIQDLNNRIAELQRLSARSKEDNRQSQTHSTTVVDNLRNRLKDATLEFKDVLTLRTDNLKHNRDRRQMYGKDADPEAGLPLLSKQRPGMSNPDGASSSSSAPPSYSFLAPSQQQQQLQMSLAQPQDTYLSSRADALKNVENTIVELGTIFTKLSELVHDQGELAIRIDENIDDTLSNVTNAQAQLLKYFNSISSNRWLILKVFFTLLIFLVVFVAFIA